MQQSSEAILAHEPQITANNGGVAVGEFGVIVPGGNPDAKKAERILCSAF
jgi:hypothetical protein